MQRLIAISFRNRDVVLEFSRHRFVQAVHHAQRPVTVIHRVHQQAKRKDIHDFRKAFPLRLHFFIDTEKVLLASHNSGVEAFPLQRLAQLAFDLINQMGAIAPGCSSRCFKTARAHRVKRLESQVLKFHTHFIHAQPHGNRRIDIKRFTGNALDFVAIEDTQGAHVVEPVGQFYENDTNVFCHCQCHFLKIFGLPKLYRVEFDVSELADPVH